MVDGDEPSTDAEEVRDLDAMLSAIEQEIARLQAKAEDPPRRGPPLWGSLLLLLSPVVLWTLLLLDYSLRVGGRP